MIDYCLFRVYFTCGIFLARSFLKVCCHILAKIYSTNQLYLIFKYEVQVTRNIIYGKQQTNKNNYKRTKTKIIGIKNAQLMLPRLHKKLCSTSSELQEHHLARQLGLIANVLDVIKKIKRLF